MENNRFKIPVKISRLGVHRRVKRNPLFRLLNILIGAVVVTFGIIVFIPKDEKRQKENPDLKLFNIINGRGNIYEGKCFLIILFESNYLTYAQYKIIVALSCLE